MVPLCFHLNISVGVRNVHYWDYNTNRSTPVGAWCWWSPSLSQLITFEKPKRIFVTKGSCWCVPRSSILRIRHQRNKMRFFFYLDSFPKGRLSPFKSIYVYYEYLCNMYCILYIWISQKVLNVRVRKSLQPVWRDNGNQSAIRPSLCLRNFNLTIPQVELCNIS